ncbi:MAG: EamA family transporter, partial [Burkholderiales bacterium]|nr:EamA family transporter [Burkholderiales bacterium]
MKPLHLLLALAVMAIWGTNFVVIEWGLREFPPLLFACLRFFFSAVPAIFFLRRPATPWRYLAGYGVLLGAGQFGLLFLAMNGHISPGLASLIVQMQVVFTIALSVAMFRERVPVTAIVGTALAVAGLATVGAHFDATITPTGLVLILCAAFCWACANVVVKVAARRGPPFNMLAFIVWSSVFAVPPLLALSFAFEDVAMA